MRESLASHEQQGFLSTNDKKQLLGITLTTALLAPTALIYEANTSDAETTSYNMAAPNNCNDIDSIDIANNQITIYTTIATLAADTNRVSTPFGDTEEKKAAIKQEAAQASGLVIPTEADVHLPDLVFDSPANSSMTLFNLGAEYSYDIQVAPTDTADRQLVTDALLKYYTSNPIEITTPETWNTIYIADQITAKDSGQALDGFAIPFADNTVMAATYKSMLNPARIVAHEKSHTDTYQRFDADSPCNFKATATQLKGLPTLYSRQYISEYAGTSMAEDWAETATIAQDPIAAFAVINNAAEFYRQLPENSEFSVHNDPILAKLAIAMSAYGNPAYFAHAFNTCLEDRYYASCTTTG